MIDWLKYSRLKLRSDDSYCPVKGPNFDKAKPCSIRPGTASWILLFLRNSS